MGSYCKKNYLPPPNVKFFYNDQLLNGEQTPDDVNMENNDIITIKIEVIR